MNHDYTPSNSIQTISNTAHLIYVYQCDKSSTKVKLYAPTSLYSGEQKRPQIAPYDNMEESVESVDDNFIEVVVYHG